MNIQDTPVRKTQCATCVFKTERQGGIHLKPGRREEIQLMLLEDGNQVCHHGNNAICRGGRDYQLTIYHRMGYIAEPTDEALAEAMRAAGIQPGKHIGGPCDGG